MKSTKFFVALAATTLFAACAQEEIAKVDTPQKMEEVVGTKLIGVDLSMSATKDNYGTRLSEGLVKGWDESDVIGLGWIVNGNPWTDQIETNLPNTDVLYANQMFSWTNGEVDEFTSRGNFYQGWHFAYYPWGNMVKTAKKRFVVNPPQKKAEGEQNPLYLRMSQALNISSKKFLTADDIENNTLTENFVIYPTVNFMNIKTNPAEGTEFANPESVLGSKAIKEVTVSVGKAIFAQAVELNPSQIPTWTAKDTDAETASLNRAAFMENLYAATNPILKKGNLNEGDLYVGLKDNSLSESVTTDVEATGYKVSDKTQLITIVTPATATIEPSDVVITVTLTNNSFFEIRYTGEDEENPSAIKNNNAILKLVAAWGAAPAEDAKAYSGVYNSAANQSVGFEVELYEDIYNTDATFENVTTYDEWKDAIEMIDFLGITEQTITIDGAIDFANGFLMPKNEKFEKLTVERVETNEKGEKLTSKETLENFYLNITGNVGTEAGWWPAQLDAVKVKVEIAEGVTVGNAHEIKALQVVNNGTLNVPDNETLESANKLGTKNCRVINNGDISLGFKSTVDNVENNKTIEVVYGSYVTLYDSKNNGDIVYLVSDSDVKNPYQIKNVIDPSAEKTAHVNVLKFDAKNEIAEFSFTKEGYGGYDDPYTGNGTGSTQTDYIAQISELIKTVNFDINNVAVSTALPLTVKNVVMTGEKASLKGVSVTEGLTATNCANGVVVVECKSIAGSLKTDGNVNATAISGGIYANSCIIDAETIEGGIEAENAVTITAKTISGGVAKGVNVAITAKTISGDVNITNSDITADQINGSVAVSGSTNNLYVGEITNDVTINNGANIEGTNIGGNVLIVAGTVVLTDINVAGALENKGIITINGSVVGENATEPAAIGSIDNNGTLNANTNVTVSTIAVNKNSSVTVADEKTIWYTTPKSEGGYIQKGTTTGVVEYKGANDVVAELKTAIAAGGEVTLVADVTLDETLTIAEGNNVVLNLNGKTLTGNVENSGNLTLQNGNIETATGTAVYNKGVATLTNVNVSSSDLYAVYNVGKAVQGLPTEGKPLSELSEPTEVMTIKGGTFKCTNPSTGTKINYYTIYCTENALLNIYDAEVVGKDGALTVNWATVNLYNTVVDAENGDTGHDLNVFSGIVTYDENCVIGNNQRHFSAGDNWGYAVINDTKYDAQGNVVIE